jgi:hypothetical protein
LASRCGWDAEAVKSWEGATLQINRPLEAANAEWLKVEYEVLIDDPQDIGALHTVEFVFCFEEEDDSALEGDRWRGPIDVRAGDPMRAAEILL